MKREIGSEFWIDNKSYFCEDSILNNFQYLENILLTSSGRGAIDLILKSINVNKKKALVPIYICDSVIKVFTINGYEVSFYDVDRILRPINIDTFLQNDISVFFHLGYFGFYTNENLEKICSDLKKKGVIVIEDITHTIFSKRMKAVYNNFSVASLRKWLGIPTGGLVSSEKKINQKLNEVPNTLLDFRIKGMKTKCQYIDSGGEELKENFLNFFANGEDILEKNSESYNIDELSKNILMNTSVGNLKKKRRRNFYFLLEKLGGISEIQIIFESLPDNITPLFFPIYVRNDREDFRKYLSSKKIYCPIHWPIPESVQVENTKMAQGIYKEILSIPCDQRYELDDMERIVLEIENYFQKER